MPLFYMAGLSWDYTAGYYQGGTVYPPVGAISNGFTGDYEVFTYSAYPSAVKGLARPYSTSTTIGARTLTWNGD